MTDAMTDAMTAVMTDAMIDVMIVVMTAGMNVLGHLAARHPQGGAPPAHPGALGHPNALLPRHRPTRLA